MCGICFCFILSRKIPISFDFFPFLSYIENSYSNKNLKDCPYSDEIYSDYFHYITKNNLFINDFTLHSIEKYMQSRGPDSFNILIQNNNKTISYLPKLFNKKPIFSNLSANNDDNSDYKTISAGSVLHLRGEINQPNTIPLFDYEKTKNIFLYNGEIYSLKKENINQLPVFLQNLGIKSFDVYKNDTNQLFEIFNNYSLIYKLEKEKNLNYEDNLLAIVDCFHGDFAFIFYDFLNNHIIIGKDIYGKKSLLLGFHQNGFCISSCAASINQKVLNHEEFEEEQNDPEENGKIDQEFLQKKYLNEFLASKNKEWLELPPQSLTFVKISCEKEGFIKNIVFSNKKFPSSKIFAMPHSIQYEESKENISKNISENEETVKKILLKSVKRILKNIIEYKQYFMKTQNQPVLSKSHEFSQNPEQSQTGSKIAIMFSGGIDSALLAHLANLILPLNESIDLLNVSFDPSSPDRKTSIRSYNELKTLSPMRNYNLILIDKNLSDIEGQEKDLLENIYPKMTHMDFNIATALKFASKGVGYLFEDAQKIQIRTSSKVILSGLGADEIFGGYMRYYVAYHRGGLEELSKEMHFDLNRLWIRNLGRDDRAISDNGKECRYPFLDEIVVNGLSKVNFKYLTNFDLPKGGGGEKFLLRKLSKSLGLKESADEKKRAIQFGTKIAKQLNIKYFGSNRKAKGTFTYKMGKEKK